MTKIKVDEVTIEGIVYVPKTSIPQTALSKDGMPFVMIRTHSAGVFCGYLKRRDGKEVELVDAIRIWYWKGAASLSQLAIDGTNCQKECKFGVPVNITLTEAIEIIEMTVKAQESIQSTPSWKM